MRDRSVDILDIRFLALALLVIPTSVATTAICIDNFYGDGNPSTFILFAIPGAFIGMWVWCLLDHRRVAA